MSVVINGTPGITTPAVSGDGSALTNLPAPTSADVGSATAGLAVGAVGTYAWLGHLTGNTTITVGGSYAGSSLAYSGATVINNATNLASWFTGTFNAAGSPPGTWKAMGHNVPYAATNISAQTLFLRIA